MIVLITVKHNIVRDLTDKLLQKKVDFEFDSMRGSFRIKKVFQLMLLTDKNSYLLSTELLNPIIEIHEDNIEQFCIAHE